MSFRSRPLTAPFPPRAPSPGSAVLRPTSLFFSFLVALAAPVQSATQEPYSPLVPKGMARLGIRSDYSIFSARYGRPGDARPVGNELEDLGAAFTGPAGSNIFPALARFEAAVRTASGESYTMNLGSMASVMEKSSVRLPISVDVGVFDWLTLGGLVPLVRNETEIAFSFAADSADVNAGFSPGLANEAAVSEFLSGLQGSISAYQGFRNSACAGDPTSSECREATEVLTSSHSFHQALSTMYGTWMAPAEWSPAGVALQARLTALSEAYHAAGIFGTPATVPLSGALLDLEDLQRLVTDSLFGIAASHPLEKWKSLWMLGDVEVRANARFLKKGDEADSYHIVVGGGALLRLPTATQNDPANFMDAGSGDGQPDLEVRGWTNGHWRGRLGLWADFRYGIQFKGTAVRRVFDPTFAMAPLDTQVQLEWKPGDYQLVELSPWYRLTDPLTLFVGYRYFRKGQDAFTMKTGEVDPAASSLPDPDVLVRGSLVSSGKLSLGMVFNRAGSFQGGVLGSPLEIRAVYRQVAGGIRGVVPATRSLEAGFRFYVGLWGRQSPGE